MTDMTVKDTAMAVDVHRQQVRIWIYRGWIDAYKSNDYTNTWKIPNHQLEACRYLAGRTQRNHDGKEA